MSSSRRSPAYVGLSEVLGQGKGRSASFSLPLSSLADQPADQAPSSCFKIDPLLTRFISYQQDRQRRAEENSVEQDCCNIGILSTLLASPRSSDARHTISSVSHAIQVWKYALTSGRCPLVPDFGNDDNDLAVWPPQPLFSLTSNAFTSMGLPRMAKRYPETIPAIIRSLLTMTLSMNQQSFQENSIASLGYDKRADLTNRAEANYTVYHRVENDDNTIVESIKSPPVDMDAEIERLAEFCVDEFLVSRWEDFVQGASLFADVYGKAHPVLFNLEDETGFDNNFESSVAFGLDDAIWKHSGWQLIPTLQRKISQIPELKKLVKELGRRPTIKDSDSIQRFLPRQQQENGSLGAEWDPQNRESVNDLYFSNRLTEMLPSEAVLLKSKANGLKALFLQRLAESKLLSYQHSGWSDVPSVQSFQTRRLRMPSAPGGPIIICLDTSWSMMTSSRETLSKAVVLAMVQAANAQRRSCQVVAFSSRNNVMESGVMSSEKNGKHDVSTTLPRLLDFLSNSFGGGSDVTGALKFAISEFEESVNGSGMDAADILLISDGEIPDPPVSQVVMNQLDILKTQKGVKIHGLLVGKRESEPLARICTQIHDFLNDYDEFASSPLSWTRSMSPTSLGVTTSGRKYSTSSFNWRLGKIRSRQKGCRGNTKLFSMNDDMLNEWNEDRGELRLIKKREKRRKQEKRQEQSKKERKEDSSRDPYLDQVQKVTDRLISEVTSTIEERRWSRTMLENERNHESSCWKYRSQVEAAICHLTDGLVERSGEARLVVLALLSSEHILLLGRFVFSLAFYGFSNPILYLTIFCFFFIVSPGTGKSVLGRRLSDLCCGSFFQRLLTRFTTPEELFGPLSLRSLENDEYRRVTRGYLPTASIAFLDEIFKANSAILNTLLTILNERKFDNAGGQEDCTIRCVMGASNELPESDELAALFDRFLIRKEVKPVSDEGMLKMLSLTNSNDSQPFACDIDVDVDGKAFSSHLDDLLGNFSAAADAVELKEDICEIVVQLRNFLREELLVDISDRRVVKAARLLKLSAASDGRRYVDPIDCLLLQHCLWEMPEQRQAIHEWLLDHLPPGGTESDSVANFRLLLEGLRDEAMSCVRKINGDVTGKYGARASDIEVLQSLQFELSQIKTILEQKLASADRFISLLDNANTYLWLDENEMDHAKQVWIPKANSYIEEIKRTLSNAMTLICSIDSESSFSDNVRLSIIDQLWEAGYAPEVVFSDMEMGMSMKEAKAKYDLETFRKWKRAKKKSNDV